MQIKITGKTALKTAGKYVAEDINILPKEEQEKTVTITENGTTEVTSDEGKTISKVTVTTNVEATISAIEEVSTAAAMEALLVSANVGKAYKFTGTTDDTYTNGDVYEVVSE